MDDNLIIVILIMLFGDKFVKFIMSSDKDIQLPFSLVHSIIFVTIFHVGLLFFAFVFLTKGFHIPWGALYVVSTLISFFSALIILAIDKSRDKNGKS